MTALEMHTRSEGDVRTPHTAQVLPRVVRHVTGRNADGKSVFLSTDDDDRHHRELVRKSSITTTIYPTSQHPVERNGDVEEPPRENEAQPEPSVENGSGCRMVDFAPGSASPMQRVHSLDCAVVIEGVFRLILDSGEERTLRRGDIAVQQSTARQWVNVTGNGLRPARILVVPLRVDEPGEKAARKPGRPGRDAVRFPTSRDNEEGLVRGRYARFYDTDYWESEF